MYLIEEDFMSSSQNTSQQQQTGTSGNSGKRRALLYIIIAIVALAIIAVALAYFVTPSSPAISQTMSANSTPIYMSASQMQSLIGSQLGNYNATDLFNQYALINVSYLVEIVPQLYGNITSGWMSAAYGTNITSNATIYYIVMTTNNTQSIAQDVGDSLNFFVNTTTPVVVNPGTYNGLDYTYGEYTNSTTTFQTVYGWKNRNVAIALVYENPGSLVNETQFIDTVANDTP